jgi:hypothetical protein
MSCSGNPSSGGRNEREETKLKTSLYSLKDYTAGPKWPDETTRFMTIDRMQNYWVVDAKKKECTSARE